MNDNDIIKALEYIVRVAEEIQQCSIAKFVPVSNIKLALDLINRQKAEIERLQDRNHKCIYLSDDETTEYCVDAICPKFKTEGQIKSEAIKEFAEELKKRCIKGGIYPAFVNAQIKALVKEMTAEEKNT